MKQKFTKITNTVFPCEIRQQNFARYHDNCSEREELEHVKSQLVMDKITVIP